MSPEARARGRYVLIAAAVTVALIAAGAVLYRETRRAERDRHEILTHVANMERLIRTHSPDLWSHVEGEHAGPAAPPAQDSVHQQMNRDFERLQHVVDFRMVDVVARVSGDGATAKYRIQGRPESPQVGPGFKPQPVVIVPSGGEIRFERRNGQWVMIGHRFVE